ncbi:uncharacterized protein LOC129308188 isoform X2 [Prosopis cineraria]|uniref:uncharacterized protein LOC129308188 isoform X2 n=1 Tax=Prosopis cineraria TaxID=364024 RepID=UPI00240EAC44|nr:uncharacterized protein LOC129308188 isoform X2 [Prosopis cineraria]
MSSSPSFSSSQHALPPSIPLCRLQSPVVSRCFRPRPRSRRRLKNLTNLPTSISTKSSSDSDKLQTVIDLNHLTAQASSSFRALFPSFESNLTHFVSSGIEACRDLQTLIIIDENRRVVLSCRPPTLHFFATSAVLSFVSISVLRALIKSVSRFRLCGRNASGYAPLVRRDRSLGGKEVIVGRNNSPSRVSANPLSPPLGPLMGSIPKRAAKTRARVEGKLPRWWPTLVTRAISMEDEQEYKRDAYRLVRAIKDSRMSGKDIMEDEIIQLRQICRTSGVQVSIDPPNIRDSLYRASVEFVLNACGRAPSNSNSIEINDEDSREFLAGFAGNIGLENSRAATIVSAAVAARTRSCLLQAWALEMQGKHDEAKLELSQICLLLRIFPPEDSSPEMEMVARGLEKHLKLEQRKHLMDIFAEVCGEGSHKTAREALGLMHLQNCCSDHQLEDRIL